MKIILGQKMKDHFAQKNSEKKGYVTHYKYKMKLSSEELTLEGVVAPGGSFGSSRTREIAFLGATCNLLRLVEV